jgi:hypothetical protein
VEVTVTASTGAKVVVWREQELFSARRASTFEPSQTCLPVDLFEVIADLAGLNLDDDGDSSEAVWLAAEAVRVLRAMPTERSKATASWGLDRDGPERWSV